MTIINVLRIIFYFILNILIILENKVLYIFILIIIVGGKNHEIIQK